MPSLIQEPPHLYTIDCAKLHVHQTISSLKGYLIVRSDELNEIGKYLEKFIKAEDNNEKKIIGIVIFTEIIKIDFPTLLGSETTQFIALQTCEDLYLSLLTDIVEFQLNYQKTQVECDDIKSAILDALKLYTSLKTSFTNFKSMSKLFNFVQNCLFSSNLVIKNESMDIMFKIIHLMDDYTINEYKNNLISVTLNILIEEHTKITLNSSEVRVIMIDHPDSEPKTLLTTCINTISDLVFMVEKKQGISKKFFHPLFSYFNQFGWEYIDLAKNIYTSIISKFTISNMKEVSSSSSIYFLFEQIFFSLLNISEKENQVQIILKLLSLLKSSLKSLQRNFTSIYYGKEMFIPFKTLFEVANQFMNNYEIIEEIYENIEIYIKFFKVKTEINFIFGETLSYLKKLYEKKISSEISSQGNDFQFIWFYSKSIKCLLTFGMVLPETIVISEENIEHILSLYKLTFADYHIVVILSNYFDFINPEKNLSKNWINTRIMIDIFKLIIENILKVISEPNIFIVELVKNNDAFEIKSLDLFLKIVLIWKNCLLCSDYPDILLLIGPFFNTLKKEIIKIYNLPNKNDGSIFISGIAICSLIRIIVKYLNTFDLRVLMINAIDSISNLSDIRLFLISDSFIENESKFEKSLHLIFKSIQMDKLSEIDNKIFKSDLFDVPKINNIFMKIFSNRPISQGMLSSFEIQLQKELDEIQESISKESLGKSKGLYSLENSLNDNLAESDNSFILYSKNK